MGEVRYMISEAAKKLQVESHVLRYWEEELGLEIGRTDMGHRYYTEDDIQLFLCIQKLKNEGMLLRDLKFMIPELTAARKRLNAAKNENEDASENAAGNADTDGSKTDGALADSREGGSTGSIQPGKADGIQARQAGGVHLSKAGGAQIKQADGGQLSKADGIQIKQADGVHLSKADGAQTRQADDVQLSKADRSPADAQSGSAAKHLPQESASLASAHPSAPEADVIQMTQLEQVRSLIGDVLTDVVSANNETLKKDISRKVTSDVIREMDFLFQANERREEEHYRKLDVLIRQQQAGRREAAKETPLGKLKKLLT